LLPHLRWPFSNGHEPHHLLTSCGWGSNVCQKLSAEPTPRETDSSIEYNQKKTESQKMTRSNPMYGWIFQGHWPKPPQNQLSPENSGPLK
jgi:hypothetical protein